MSALEAGVGNDPCTLAWDLPASPLGCLLYQGKTSICSATCDPFVPTRPDAAFGLSNHLLAAYAKTRTKEGKSRRGNSDTFRQVGSPKHHSICAGAPSEGIPRGTYAIVSLRWAYRPLVSEGW